MTSEMIGFSGRNLIANWFEWGQCSNELCNYWSSWMQCDNSVPLLPWKELWRDRLSNLRRFSFLTDIKSYYGEQYRNGNGNLCRYNCLLPLCGRDPFFFVWRGNKIAMLLSNCSSHHLLLNEVTLRERWGWRGEIVTCFVSFFCSEIPVEDGVGCQGEW